MVSVYTACCRPDHCRTIVNDHLHLLPVSFVERALRFKFEIDYYRCVVSKILLSKAVGMEGYKELDLHQLRFTAYDRPFFEHELSFNISHSGDYVVCALSKAFEVGVDIEEIKPINFDEFEQCFTSREWRHIHSSGNPLGTFYRFWTRKEAIMKADGRGMHLPLLSFEAIDDAIAINGNKWHIKALAIDENYEAHLATNLPIANNYSIQQII